MSKYNCPRCGYSTNISQCYIKHIHRKNICKAIISNVTLENEHDKHIKHIKQIKNKKKNSNVLYVAKYYPLNRC